MYISRIASHFTQPIKCAHLKVRTLLFYALIFLLLSNSNPAISATYIENTAHVTYTLAGIPHDAPSNTVVTSLVPLVDVETTALTAQSDTLPNGSPGFGYTFHITNTGTSADQYELTTAFTDRSAPVDSLWLDTNHNHKLDSGVDLKLSDATLSLAAGASADVLVLSATRGTMNLTATSTIDDVTVVVRRRQAQAALTLDAENDADEVTLVKSQSVDTNGAAAPDQGSFITYSLTAHIPAHAAITDGLIADQIPAGTTYVSDSLTYDGTALTDIADADMGTFNTASQTITVALPVDSTNAAISADHTVRFQVRIN
jgi:uncharacterized repeat protein (TIGR01451 family)